MTTEPKKYSDELMHIAKDSYLIWKDHYDKQCYVSYPLWDSLNDAKKAWWCEFVEDVHTRRIRLNKN